jgi:type II secretory pathway component PulF
LAALLEAQLPLAQALASSEAMTGPEAAEVLRAVRASVERGERLAEAMAAFPVWFPPRVIGLVRAGERSGALAPAFATLADQLEREAALRDRITSAALYPALLLVAGGAALVVLLTVVLPNFAALLRDAGATLPRSTAIVLAIGAVLRQGWWVLLVVVGAMVVGVAALRDAPAGRRWLAERLAQLPLIGGLRRELAAARFARIAGTLLRGGAPLVQALTDTEASLDDPLAADATARIAASVRDGTAFHAAIADEAYFPPALAQLVAVGESAGALGDFLIRAAVLFEERAGRALQRAVTLAEPTIIVVFGGAVGFIALSLLQAIYSVNAGAFR